MVPRLLATLFLIAAFVLQMQAQSKESGPPPSMSKPGPGSERARLAFLVGEFTTATRVMSGRPGGKEALGTGTSSVRWGLDSMFLFIDEQSKNSMLGQYKGFGVLGFNHASSQYTLAMYNNFGDSPEYHGAFSGDTLVMATRVPFPGGSFDQKLFWFPEAGTVHLKVFNDMGKGPVQVVDQVGHRSSAATGPDR